MANDTATQVLTAYATNGWTRDHDRELRTGDVVLSRGAERVWIDYTAGARSIKFAMRVRPDHADDLLGASHAGKRATVLAWLTAAPLDTAAPVVEVEVEQAAQRAAQAAAPRNTHRAQLDIEQAAQSAGWTVASHARSTVLTRSTGERIWVNYGRGHAVRRAARSIERSGYAIERDSLGASDTGKRATVLAWIDDRIEIERDAIAAFLIERGVPAIEARRRCAALSRAAVQSVTAEIAERAVSERFTAPERFTATGDPLPENTIERAALRTAWLDDRHMAALVEDEQRSAAQEYLDRDRVRALCSQSPLTLARAERERHADIMVANSHSKTNAVIRSAAQSFGWSDGRVPVDYYRSYPVLERGAERVSIRWSMSGAITWAMLEVDGLYVDSIDASDTGKRDRVIGWLSAWPATGTRAGRHAHAIAVGAIA